MFIPVFGSRASLSHRRAFGFIVAASLITPFVGSGGAKVAHADTFGGTRLDEGDVKCYYDPSVDSYGYGSYFDGARARWSIPSSKVNMLKVTSAAGTPDKYYVGDNPFGDGSWGATGFYKKTFGVTVQVALDEDATYAIVSIYHDTMTSDGFTNANIQMNTDHELGHTLKLTHPGEGGSGAGRTTTPIPAGEVSVMTQGQLDYNVQPYDEGQIVLKWGA